VLGVTWYTTLAKPRHQGALVSQVAALAQVAAGLADASHGGASGVRAPWLRSGSVSAPSGRRGRLLLLRLLLHLLLGLNRTSPHESLVLSAILCRAVATLHLDGAAAVLFVLLLLFSF